MAITLLKNITKYAGTAAERAAMDVSRVNTGDTYFEWDTSKLYIYSGTAWVEKNGTVQIDNIAAGVTVIGKMIPSDTDGDEKFTAGNPAVMQLSGSNIEVNDSIILIPDVESIIVFTNGCSNLLVTNLGLGDVYISFDDIPATTATYMIESGRSISGMACQQLRLLSQTSPKVQWLGGLK